MSLRKTIVTYTSNTTKWLNFLSPISDVALRLWVANIFWMSGLVKIQNMDSTLWLFHNEYHVPVLSPWCATYIATGIELGLPVLLVLGLFTRLTAFVMIVFDIACVVSYTQMPADAINDHIVWGLMLLVLLLHGPGKISLDYFIWQRIHKNSNPKPAATMASN